MVLSIGLILLLISPILDAPRAWINDGIINGMWRLVDWPFTLMGI